MTSSDYQVITPPKTNMEPENIPWKRRNAYKPPSVGFRVNFQGCTRWWFQICVKFHPYLGKIPILTNIFQMGWKLKPPTNVYSMTLWRHLYKSCWTLASLPCRPNDTKVSCKTFWRSGQEFGGARNCQGFWWLKETFAGIWRSSLFAFQTYYEMFDSKKTHCLWVATRSSQKIQGVCQKPQGRYILKTSISLF